jgi:probable phosphoglycerate mutase
VAEQKSRFVCVRHGETEWSATRRHTGRSDIPLEPEGEKQAVQVGRRLTDHEFSLVLTSPLERARRTCELAGFGDVATEDDDLAEWDYGEMEGRTTEQIRTASPDWSIWTDGVSGGESLEHVSERADRVVSNVRRQEGDVLAFAHAHILRVIAARWLGLEPDYGRSLVLGPATISILGWEREIPVVVRWNDGTGDPLS